MKFKRPKKKLYRVIWIDIWKDKVTSIVSAYTEHGALTKIDNRWHCFTILAIEEYKGE